MQRQLDRSDDWLAEYLAECREIVLDEMKNLVRLRGRNAPLYDLILEYPLRGAKALRPALCIAVCRALGGILQAVSASATALELYHNAFLIHDDVEDGSEKRRDGLTLHRAHGLPVAVNVGDAMLALALDPLLDNMRLLSVGKALRIIQLIATMARESAEGQAYELAWTREGCWDLRDADYLRMIHKKTTYYSFVTPVAIGGLIASATEQQLYHLRLYATALGAAFQVQDDILNLAGEEQAYGKEIGGDLWEGKHTLILLHAMRSATPTERAHAHGILRKGRPSDMEPRTNLCELMQSLEAVGELSARARACLEEAWNTHAAARPEKTGADVVFLRDLIERYDSLSYARNTAQRHARRAQASLLGMHSFMPASVHRDFLHELTDFVVAREH